MRLTIRSNHKLQIIEISYVRESSEVPNLRIHNNKGLSQAVKMPDLKTRNRVLKELAVQGSSYVNTEDAEDVVF